MRRDRPAEALSLDVTTISEVELSPVAPASQQDLVALSAHVLGAEGAIGRWEVAFLLVDDARLQRFHLDFMGIDEPTDVMTFENEPDDGEPGLPVRGGDVIISVDRVVEQSSANGNTAGRELHFVAVHGLLHLTGWVDHSSEERAAMLARGEELLRGYETRSVS